MCKITNDTSKSNGLKWHKRIYISLILLFAIVSVIAFIGLIIPLFGLNDKKQIAIICSTVILISILVAISVWLNLLLKYSANNQRYIELSKTLEEYLNSTKGSSEAVKRRSPTKRQEQKNLNSGTVSKRK